MPIEVGYHAHRNPSQLLLHVSIKCGQSQPAYQGMVTAPRSWWTPSGSLWWIMAPFRHRNKLAAVIPSIGTHWQSFRVTELWYPGPPCHQPVSSGVRHRKPSLLAGPQTSSSILPAWELPSKTPWNTDPVLNRVRGCATLPHLRRYLGNEGWLLLTLMLKENNLHTEVFPSVLTKWHRKGPVLLDKLNFFLIFSDPLVVRETNAATAMLWYYDVGYSLLRW